MDLLKSLVGKYGSFGQAVDLKEMEKLAKGLNRKIKDKEKESPIAAKRELRRQDEEERDEIEKKLRKYQFKDLYKRRGLVEAVKEKIFNFYNFATRNRKAKKVYELASIDSMN